MTPLRQFKGVPPDIIRRAEAKQFVSSPTLPDPHFVDALCLSRGIVISIW